MKKNLNTLSLTAAVSFALIGSALAAGQVTAQAQPTTSAAATAQAPASERSEQRGQRGTPSAEQLTEMKAGLQTRVTELLAQSGSNAEAAGWLRQAQTLLNSTDAEAGHTAMNLIRAAETALGVEPQRGEGGEGFGRGPGGHHADRQGEAPRAELTAEQLAARQAEMKTLLQTRVTELLAQSGSNAEAAAWLNQAQALLNSTDAEAGRTAVGLIHAAEGALGVEPQRGGRGFGGPRGEGDAQGRPAPQGAPAAPAQSNQ